MTSINAETKLIGLIGNPVKHSLSPEIHNRAFQVCHLNMRYLAFAVEPEFLESAVKGMAALGFGGFNVTIPYKELVMPLLDKVQKDAKIIGAVNTVVIKGGKLHGYNTDGIGFIRSLEEKGISPAGKNIVIIGAGGAAKAVGIALALREAKSIVIANRTFSHARDLSCKIAELGVKSGAVDTDWLKEEENLKTADIVINATPVGMLIKEDSPLFSLNMLPKGAVVCDLIYGPRKSKLIQEASDLGYVAIDGAGMLIYQGAEAYRLFTGLTPPVEDMYKALHVALCQKM